MFKDVVSAVVVADGPATWRRINLPIFGQFGNSVPHRPNVLAVMFAVLFASSACQVVVVVCNGVLMGDSVLVPSKFDEIARGDLSMGARAYHVGQAVLVRYLCRVRVRFRRVVWRPIEGVGPRSRLFVVNLGRRAFLFTVHGVHEVDNVF